MNKWRQEIQNVLKHFPSGQAVTTQESRMIALGYWPTCDRAAHVKRWTHEETGRVVQADEVRGFLLEIDEERRKRRKV